MPICAYRSGHGRVCKSEIIEQDACKFVSLQYKKLKVVKSCLACRKFYRKYREADKVYEVLPLTPPDQLSSRTRQMMTDLRIKKE